MGSFLRHQVCAVEGVPGVFVGVCAGLWVSQVYVWDRSGFFPARAFRSHALQVREEEGAKCKVQGMVEMYK